MLWRKKPQNPPNSSPAAVALPEGDEAALASEDKALDAVGGLLREYGKHAVDVAGLTADEICKRCEEWAVRISIGAPKADESARENAPLRRDWPGLRQFFSELRRAESEYVEKSLTDLRDAVRTFASHMSRALEADRASDARIQERLQALSSAIDSNDTTLVRSAAESVIHIVGESMETRKSRELAQIRELGRKLKDLHGELDQARQRAAIDPLTQLFNRSVFDERLARLVELSPLFERLPCLLLADIDHFKAVNDKYGHPTGDEVLRRVADTLARTFVRRQDLVCRYGGEEFAIVLVETDSKSVEMLANRLLDALRRLEVSHGSSRIKVTVSIGMAELGRGETPLAWLERADRALYDAKQSGRDRLVVAKGV
jgi:diguanylate cyclase (GGDEF)-like protein